MRGLPFRLWDSHLDSCLLHNRCVRHAGRQRGLGRDGGPGPLSSSIHSFLCLAPCVDLLLEALEPLLQRRGTAGCLRPEFAYHDERVLGAPQDPNARGVLFQFLEISHNYIKAIHCFMPISVSFALLFQLLSSTPSVHSVHSQRVLQRVSAPA